MARWRRILLVVFVASAGPARAESPDPDVVRAKNHMQAAISYYDDGRYEDAAREIATAYRIKPIAALQYNLAQCYERLGRTEEAVEAYQTYLDGSPRADDRELIARRLQNLRKRLEVEKTRGTAEPAPATNPPAEEKVVFKTIVVYREAPPAPGRGARIAAYGLGVLALAGLATGIAFSVLAAQDADTVTHGGSTSMPPFFEGSAAEAQSSGRTRAILAIVGFAVAAASAGGAVGLFLLGRKIDREAPRLTLAPTLSPWGGGLALGGTF